MSCPNLAPPRGPRSLLGQGANGGGGAAEVVGSREFRCFFLEQRVLICDFFFKNKRFCFDLFF